MPLFALIGVLPFHYTATKRKLSESFVEVPTKKNMPSHNMSDSISFYDISE